jgi:hypothetical protein
VREVGTLMVIATLAQAGAILMLAAGLVSRANALQEISRLRSDDAALVSSIIRAVERSRTLRHVVNELHATDGIVTIERGRCRPKLPACLLFWVGAGGPHRILRVVIDQRVHGDEAVVFLAHELRHALEVLAEPSVKSGSEIYFLFKRIGSWQGDVFETQAADDVEAAVRRELIRTRE